MAAGTFQSMGSGRTGGEVVWSGRMSPAVRNPPTAPPASTGSHPPEPGTGQQDGRRRGIRTVLISAVGLPSLAALAIGVLWSSLAPPESTGTNQRPGTETFGPGSESLQA